MNGIKPTHLWHLTGRKHFRKLLNDRDTSVKHSLQPRERGEFIKFTGYLVACALGTWFAFGGFGPKNNCPMKKEPISKTCVSNERCPPEHDKKPMKPCPKCGGKKEKKKCDPDE